MTDIAELAAEQLYDELLARCWALDFVIAVEAPDLESLGRRCVGLIQRVERGEITTADVTRLLYPIAAPCPADAWWATPLGQWIARTTTTDASVAA